jgi:ribose-phosphate pyrophosphokinase
MTTGEIENVKHLFSKNDSPAVALTDRGGNRMPSGSHATAKLVAGNAHPGLAEALSHELNMPLIASEVTSFADGETRVHVAHDVSGAAVFIVQPTCPPVNEHLMILALLADALQAAGAAQVTAIAPYFGYARQEQRGRSGDPRSAQVASRLLGAVGIDHLITLDLHSPALESAFPMPATLLHAEELFLPKIKSWHLRDLVVVSPDAGGMKRAQRYALALESPLAVIAKQRPQPDLASVLQVLGDVRDRICLVVDDMASTGRTLAGAAEALRRAGAREIRGVFTHAVMAPGAEERLFEAQFAKLLTSDSIPVVSNEWLEVAPCAPILAKTIQSLTCKEGASHQ